MATDNNINSREQHRTSRTLWFLYCLFLILSVVLMGRIVYLQFIWEPDPKYVTYFQPKKDKNEIE